MSIQFLAAKQHTLCSYAINFVIKSVSLFSTICTDLDCVQMILAHFENGDKCKINLG